jgi:hypothetical protein
MAERKEGRRQRKQWRRVMVDGGLQEFGRAGCW